MHTPQAGKCLLDAGSRGRRYALAPSYFALRVYATETNLAQTRLFRKDNAGMCGIGEI